MAGRDTAEHRAQRLRQLGELERTLATVARLAAGKPVYRDVMAKLEEQFTALARAVRRSAARDADMDRAYARHSAATVTQAMLELRSEAHRAATETTTTVDSGLRQTLDRSVTVSWRPSPDHTGDPWKQRIGLP